MHTQGKRPPPPLASRDLYVHFRYQHPMTSPICYAMTGREWEEEVVPPSIGSCITIVRCPGKLWTLRPQAVARKLDDEMDFLLGLGGYDRLPRPGCQESQLCSEAPCPLCGPVCADHFCAKFLPVLPLLRSHPWALLEELRHCRTQNYNQLVLGQIFIGLFD